MHKMMHEKVNYGRLVPSLVRAGDVMLTLILKNSVHKYVHNYACSYCM